MQTTKWGAQTRPILSLTLIVLKLEEKEIASGDAVVSFVWRDTGSKIDALILN